jgi:hypothetical protein
MSLALHRRIIAALAALFAANLAWADCTADADTKKLAATRHK